VKLQIENENFYKNTNRNNKMNKNCVLRIWWMSHKPIGFNNFNLYKCVLYLLWDLYYLVYFKAWKYCV